MAKRKKEEDTNDQLIDDELLNQGSVVHDEPVEEDEEEDEVIGAIVSGFGDLNSLINQTQPDKSNEEIEREKMKLLLANFDPEQMARYEAFRRANVNRTAVKKLANAVLNQSVTQSVAVSLSGISKVFVGEIVEKARDVQLRMDPPASIDEYDAKPKPLRPEHLREAWRLFKQEAGTVPSAHWSRQGGDGDGLMFR